MKDRRETTPRRVSPLGRELERLRIDLAAFDAMRGAPTRELAVANAKVLSRARAVIEAAFPAERVLLREQRAGEVHDDAPEHRAEYADDTD